MAIDAYGNQLTSAAAASTTASASTQYSNAVADSGANPKGILGKDDFLKLMLVQMQHQDPTEPMDAEKILSQTSQLAALEASTNTNKALDELTQSLKNSKDFTAQFSTIGAIGKMADTGGDAIVLEEEGGTASFEIYFSNAPATGSLDIADEDGNIVRSIDLHPSNFENLKIVSVDGVEVKDGKVNGKDLNEITEGVFGFTWDGKNNNGNDVDTGIYSVSSKYTDTDGGSHDTRIGLYPISSVKFIDGEAHAKLGSAYIPFDSILEVYEAN